MTDQNNAAQAAVQDPLSDDYINHLIRQHGYDSPEAVIARLWQWIGLNDGENSVTLLMYEAHKALVKLRAPVAELRIGVSATGQGATVCIMQPHSDGSITAIYSETHPAGDSLGRPALASAPVSDAVPVKASNIDTRDVDVEVHAFGSIFYDHGPNLAEALGRLAQRVARWSNLSAPSLASAPVAGEANKWVARVRVKHSGYAMELSEYVTYALPEGMHDLYAAPQASEAVRDAKAEGFQAGLDKALEVLEHDDFATRMQSAQVIRALKFQSAALSAQPGAQKGGSDA